MKERSINDIVETLKHAKRNKRGCALLLGAGCSVTAGVTLAAGFVSYVKKNYPAAYGRAVDKTYPKVMHELTRDMRRDLVAEEVDRARMNWAHIAVAQLVKEGFVDRVLTTNFDRLVAQACAMVGEFPAVYDFGASQDFEPENVPDKAIFHLHGQRTGFKLMITDDDVTKHAERLQPVMENTGQGRTWIVVGYSGENDGVFDNLSAAPQFGSGLYWASFKDHGPADHVKKELLDQDKDAYLVPGFEADGFFIELARKLECFPPAFADRPFTYVAGLLNTLADFPTGSADQNQDFLTITKNTIARAIDTYEKGIDAVRRGDVEQISHAHQEALEMAANFLLMAGKYDELQSIAQKLKQPASPALTDALAWSHIMQANALIQLAQSKGGAAADRLLAKACNKLQQAVDIKPDNYEALNNWGITLSEQAKTKSGAEADRLLAEAVEKFQQSLTIRPDQHEALGNWGTALLEQAKTKSGAAADRLLAEAVEKFQQSLTIRPDQHEPLGNWGTALLAHAKTKSGAEADRLLAEAVEKFQQALTIKPDQHEALVNWGNALSDRAKTKSGAEVDRLFMEAGEKYRQALTVKPDNYEALYNWGITLSEQAKTKSGAEADRLFMEAGEKYRQALTVMPDNYKALNNWGVMLMAQGTAKSGVEADRLFANAKEKFVRVEELHPGPGAYNLACLSALQGNPKECRRWLEKGRDAGTLPSRQQLETDSDLDSVRNEAWFKDFLAGYSRPSWPTGRSFFSDR